MCFLTILFYLIFLESEQTKYTGPENRTEGFVLSHSSKALILAILAINLYLLQKH